MDGTLLQRIRENLKSHHQQFPDPFDYDFWDRPEPERPIVGPSLDEQMRERGLSWRQFL